MFVNRFDVELTDELLISMAIEFASAVEPQIPSVDWKITCCLRGR